MSNDSSIQSEQTLGDGDRHPTDVLVDRYVAQIRSGAALPLSDEVPNAPEHESSARDLFPTIMALEKLRTSVAESPGRASLGPWRPETLGDYRLLRELGRGGMGVVYEAEQETLKRRVAVKILPRNLLPDDRRVRRFRHEAQTAAALHHTHIVPIFGVGEQDGFHFYVMQLIRGVPVHRSGPSLNALPPHELPTYHDLMARARWITHVGIQAAGALHYAHEQGVLHRDIKPANVLIDAHDNLWITDFGLATAVTSDGKGSGIVGTHRYMAPEQFFGTSDARSDVYSLGLTLYELLAGVPAFVDSTIGTEEAPRQAPSLAQVDRRLPRDLVSIVDRATAADPNQRYQSAAEFEADLVKFRDGLCVSARPVTFVTRGWRWSRRNPILAGLLTTCAALLVLIAALAFVDYLRVERALDRESQARLSSDRSARLATDALNQMFARFAAGGATLGQTDRPWRESLDQPILSQEAVSLLHDLLGYYDRLAAEHAHDKSTLRRAAEARRTVAEIHHQLGQYDQAISSGQQSLQLFERWRSTSTMNPSTLMDSELGRAQILNGIGRAHQLLGNQQAAETSFRSAMTVLSQLSKTSHANAAVRYELAKTHFLLGRRIRPGTGPQAVPPSEPQARRRPSEPGEDRPPRHILDGENESLRSSVALLQKLRQAYPQDPAYRLLLAACYREQASDHLTERTAEDIAEDQSAISLLEELVLEFPASAACRFELAQALAEFTILGPPPDIATLNEAHARLIRALPLNEALVAEHPQVPEYATALVHVYGKLASVQVQLFNEPGTSEVDRNAHLTNAERSLRRAVQGLSNLNDRFDEAYGYAAWQALFQERLADLLMETGRAEEAYTYQARALRLLLPLQKHEVAGPLIREQLGRTYDGLARTLDRLGDHEAASAAHAMARQTMGTAGPPGPPFGSYRPPPTRRPFPGRPGPPR